MGKVYRQNCKYCNKFYVGGGRFFCSSSCRNRFRAEYQPEWREKLRISQIKRWTKEERLKQSQKLKGKTAWNKDKTLIHSGSFKKGQIPWNKGIPRTKQERGKMSQSRKGKYIGMDNPNWHGGVQKYNCKNCKKEIFDYTSQNKGNYKFCSLRCKGIYYVSHTKKKNTKIELLIGEELNKRKINNIPQKGLFDIAVADFFLPEFNMAIFCDGEYWHRIPGRQEDDKIRTERLQNKGIKVFRFWEKDIVKSPGLCIDRIVL